MACRRVSLTLKPIQVRRPMDSFSKVCWSAKRRKCSSTICNQTLGSNRRVGGRLNRTRTDLAFKRPLSLSSPKIFCTLSHLGHFIGKILKWIRPSQKKTDLWERSTYVDGHALLQWRGKHFRSDGRPESKSHVTAQHHVSSHRLVIAQQLAVLLSTNRKKLPREWTFLKVSEDRIYWQPHRVWWAFGNGRRQGLHYPDPDHHFQLPLPSSNYLPSSLEVTVLALRLAVHDPKAVSSVSSHPLPEIQ